MLKAADNIVFVDEAYMEFAQKESVIDLIDTYPNLIVLRTLSKAFALAGMRCGYLAADEALIEAIAKIKAPYNLNAFTSSLRRSSSVTEKIFSKYAMPSAWKESVSTRR